MCVLMTSTPTGSQGLMITTCLGSLGCHNLDFVMPYVSHLFGCWFLIGKDRAFSKGKETTALITFKHGLFYLINTRPMDLFSSVMGLPGVLKFKTKETTRGVYYRAWPYFQRAYLGSLSTCILLLVSLGVNTLPCKPLTQVNLSFRFSSFCLWDVIW